MKASDWLTVGLFFFGLVGAILAFWLRRFIRTVDEHDKALNGPQGIFSLLGSYVRREAHDVANAELVAQMERLRIEATDREARILEAIERQGARAAEETRTWRTDLGRMHDRIDRIRDQQNQPPSGGNHRRS